MAASVTLQAPDGSTFSERQVGRGDFGITDPAFGRQQFRVSGIKGVPEMLQLKSLGQNRECLQAEDRACHSACTVWRPSYIGKQKRGQQKQQATLLVSICVLLLLLQLLCLKDWAQREFGSRRRFLNRARKQPCTSASASILQAGIVSSTKNLWYGSLLAPYRSSRRSSCLWQLRLLARKETTVFTVIVTAPHSSSIDDLDSGSEDEGLLRPSKRAKRGTVADAAGTSEIRHEEADTARKSNDPSSSALRSPVPAMAGPSTAQEDASMAYGAGSKDAHGLDVAPFNLLAVRGIPDWANR